MIETALGKALRAHREDCGDCTPDEWCSTYIDITNGFTQQRVIREGPRMGYTRLSIQEAEAR